MGRPACIEGYKTESKIWRRKKQGRKASEEERKQDKKNTYSRGERKEAKKNWACIEKNEKTD